MYQKTIPSKHIQIYLTLTIAEYPTFRNTRLKDTNVVIQRGTCTPMFTAAMSTIAKLWKESRCPSTDEWIKKMWCALENSVEVPQKTENRATL